MCVRLGALSALDSRCYSIGREVSKAVNSCVHLKLGTFQVQAICAAWEVSDASPSKTAKVPELHELIALLFTLCESQHVHLNASCPAWASPSCCESHWHRSESAAALLAFVINGRAVPFRVPVFLNAHTHIGHVHSRPLHTWCPSTHLISICSKARQRGRACLLLMALRYLDGRSVCHTCSSEGNSEKITWKKIQILHFERS